MVHQLLQKEPPAHVPLIAIYANHWLVMLIKFQETHIITVSIDIARVLELRKHTINGYYHAET